MNLKFINFKMIFIILFLFSSSSAYSGQCRDLFSTYPRSVRKVFSDYILQTQEQFKNHPDFLKKYSQSIIRKKIREFSNTKYSNLSGDSVRGILYFMEKNLASSSETSNLDAFNLIMESQPLFSDVTEVSVNNYIDFISFVIHQIRLKFGIDKNVYQKHHAKHAFLLRFRYYVNPSMDRVNTFLSFGRNIKLLRNYLEPQDLRDLLDQYGDFYYNIINDQPQIFEHNLSLASNYFNKNEIKMFIKKNFSLINVEKLDSLIHTEASNKRTKDNLSDLHSFYHNFPLNQNKAQNF